MTAPSGLDPSAYAFYDPAVLAHNSGNRNPESPARVPILLRAVAAGSAGKVAIVRSDRAASWWDLRRCHGESHLRRLRAEALTRGSTSSGSVPVSGGSWRAARHAAGTVLAAVDWTLAGRARRALCIVRPPGHHAGSTYAHGFCLLNNVAIAARYAQCSPTVSTVLIIDWDAHHGNGTQEIFWEDGTVGLVDVHRHPWHLDTGGEDECGAREGQGWTVNLPIRRGVGGPTVTTRLAETVDAVAAMTRPDMIFVSCGFDALAGDPVGGLRLTPADFASMTEAVVRIAERHCQGRVVSVLEGGYLSPDLGAAARIHMESLRRRSSQTAPRELS